jgi:hypothetical protein
MGPESASWAGIHDGRARSGGRMDYEATGRLIWLSSAFTDRALEAAFANGAVVREMFVERLGDTKASECQQPG